MREWHKIPIQILNRLVTLVLKVNRMMTAEIVNQIAKSSLHIIILDSSKTLRGFGSGYFVKYRENTIYYLLLT